MLKIQGILKSNGQDMKRHVSKISQLDLIFRGMLRLGQGLTAVMINYI